MSKITTEDCKALIEAQAPALGLPPTKWRRVSKSKTDVGQLRVFAHATAGELEILEPEGASSAAELRLSRRAGVDESAYEDASAQAKLGMAWVDFQRAAMGKPTLHLGAPRDLPFDTWAQVRKAYLAFEKGGDCLGADGEEVEIEEILSDLAERASAAPEGVAAMAPGVEWAFELELGELGGKADSSPPEAGLVVFAVSSILPGDSADWNSTPLCFMPDFDNLMESIFRVEPRGGATLAEEMDRVADFMEGHGFAYGKRLQASLPREGALGSAVANFSDRRAAKKEAAALSTLVGEGLAAGQSRQGPRV